MLMFLSVVLGIFIIIIYEFVFYFKKKKKTCKKYKYISHTTVASIP